MMEVKMSELLDKYHKLGMLRAEEGLDEEKEEEIIKQMAELKKQFKESDWDEWIKTAPVHIRPMIKMQKEKHLK